jgi:molecular chaperone IbpA
MTRTIPATIPNYERIFSNALGFDSLLDILHRTSEGYTSPTSNFPPVNIVRDDQDPNKYVVELAVSGFSADEIEVRAEKNSLKIVGKKEESEKRKYLLQGIAYRSFTRSFLLADSVVIKDAKLENGILSVHLENVIPDEHKPRLVKIITV